MLPCVTMLSLWRNEADRDIVKRVIHLLDKSYPNLSYIWVVGDESDGTERLLRNMAGGNLRVHIVRHDTGIVGDDSNTRLLRMGQTFNAALDALRPGNNYILVHESDLLSPRDIVERLLDIPGDVMAGWPMLNGVFYDTFAYRADGVMFTNTPPYHPRYKPHTPFEVDSVGSVWLAPASPFMGARGIRCKSGGIIDIMRALKARGMKIMVDPELIIVQPLELFVSHKHADV